MKSETKASVIVISFPARMSAQGSQQQEEKSEGPQDIDQTKRGRGEAS